LEDDLSDLREDTLLAPPIPSPKKKRKPRRPQATRSDEGPLYDYDAPGAGRALEHAAAGAALAGAMAGALGKPGKKALGRWVWTCAAVGMGAVCLGLLLYLWKRAAATEACLTKTAEELRKIAAYLESSEMLDDEPLPSRGPVSQEAVDKMLGRRVENGDGDGDGDGKMEEPKIEELLLPPLLPVPSLPTKKRKPAPPKPAVINLDDEDALTPVAEVATTTTTTTT
jgi:hypothetical protein